MYICRQVKVKLKTIEKQVFNAKIHENVHFRLILALLGLWNEFYTFCANKITKITYSVELNTWYKLARAKSEGVIFYSLPLLKAEGLEITHFEYLDLENASASGVKPPDPFDMLSFEIHRLKG